MMIISIYSLKLLKEEGGKTKERKAGRNNDELYDEEKAVSSMVVQNICFLNRSLTSFASSKVPLLYPPLIFFKHTRDNFLKIDFFQKK